MAITHNLTTINNNLSCYDPVAGEVDGTTIGRNYILWQVFQGLKEFDSNVVMVSSSGATPDWLKSQSGSIMTAPAKNASTANQRINWFYLNDVGLSGSVPNCFVYEWGTTNALTSNNNLISVAVRHVTSGSTPTVYYPFSSGSIVADSNTSQALTRIMYGSQDWNVGANNTTNMRDIPRILFWKSSNASLAMGIDKKTAAYSGYLIWHNPTFTGYRTTLSASFTDGSNFRCVVFTNGVIGATWEEGFTQTYESNLTTYGSYLNMLPGAGLMPSTQFVVSGSLTLLTQKFKFGVVSLPNFKAVSAEIEGIELSNTLAGPYGAGQITKINNKYYLPANSLYDGVQNQRVYFELGT